MFNKSSFSHSSFSRYGLIRLVFLFFIFTKSGVTHSENGTSSRSLSLQLYIHLKKYLFLQGNHSMLLSSVYLGPFHYFLFLYQKMKYFVFCVLLRKMNLMVKEFNYNF